MGRRGVWRPSARALLALLTLCLPLAAIPVPSAAVTSLRAYAIAGTATADPGDVVPFTIAMDNVGPAVAANVWANVTLPPFTGFDSAGGPAFMWLAGQWFSGNRRGWNFTNLPIANHTFTLSLRILTGAADGAVLSMPLSVNYTDDGGVLQPPTSHTARVTVSIPVIQVTKTPSENPVDPGAGLTYTITVRNTGSGAASSFWVNDTLPTQVTFVRLRNVPNPVPQHCPVQGPSVECQFTNLASGGSLTFDIDTTVKASAPRGTVILNYVFVNVTDADDTLLTPTSAFSSSDVRVVRDLTLDKVAGTALAYPGAPVTFTIWYNNTATSALGATWINDTLPGGLSYTRSVPPATVSGGTVRWQFGTVPPGGNSVELVATVGPSVANGTSLVNTATGDYIDSVGNRGQQVAASVSVTVSDALPRFDGFDKSADRASGFPGSAVRYTIRYDNTGRDTAASVVIQDTIPLGTVLANPSVTPSSVNGRTHEWRFTNVAPGPHTLAYDLVLEDVDPGATLVNFAFLNYTDPNGSPLPSPPPRSAIIQVSTGAQAGSPFALILGASLLVAIAALVGIRALRGRREAVIDEIFLLHRDGLLIKHYTRRVRPDIDSDILSGMLIAVQNFVNESFIGAEGLQKEGQLDELRFGEFKLVIERGKWVVVAAVLSGDPSGHLKDEVKAAIRELEDALGAALEGWSGEMKNVEGADHFMQDLITGKYRRAWGKA